MGFVIKKPRKYFLGRLWGGARRVLGVSWGSLAWLPIPVGPSLGCCWQWEEWGWTPVTCHLLHPFPSISKVWAWLDPHPWGSTQTSQPLCPGVSHPMGMLWSWVWVSPCPDTPLHPNPACEEAASPSTPSPVGSLLPAHFTFNYPDTSRGLPAKVCDECRGERHFGLRKDTRRLACLPLRLILDSICSLLCGALAGSQPGELKAPAQSSLSPAAGRRRGRRRREEEAPGPWGPPKAGWFLPPQQGLLQHPRASPAAACSEVSQ